MHASHQLCWGVCWARSKLQEMDSLPLCVGQHMQGQIVVAAHSCCTMKPHACD